MKENLSIYETHYTIRAAEINPYKKITFPALVQLLQESSLEHIIKLKASKWDEVLKGLSWVLVRKEIKVHRYPELGETIRIRTNPSGFDRIIAYRDYRVYDLKGNLLVEAASTWTLLNLETRKISAIPEQLLHLDTSESEEILARCPSKIKLPKSFDFNKNYTIGRYHMDWNGHVNNTNFIRFILEPIPLKDLSDQPSKLIIHYKQECFKDELIKASGTDIEEGISTHIISNEAGNVICASLISW